jgi:hypothetical protein
MSDCKYLKKIKGKIVGHVYLIDGKEMSNCQAVEYLAVQGFTAEESKMYLDGLLTDEMLMKG